MINTTCRVSCPPVNQLNTHNHTTTTIATTVPGHCYYLEDGVEERNVFERNLAAFVHPINVAGSGGGQQGTARWASDSFFDPTDAGASGFYSLNLHNSWIGNAAVGGFAGFGFPSAPRPIKDSKAALDPATGGPLVPSSRPFIAFRGNTARGGAHWWEHSACVYLGGYIFERPDSGGVNRLYYNNGRGKEKVPSLCYPALPQDDPNCWTGSARSPVDPVTGNDAFNVLEDTRVALCNVGVGSWGNRAEVRGLHAYDVTRGAEFLGQALVKDAHFQINTANTLQRWSGWPWPKYSFAYADWQGEAWWMLPPIKGFEFYDVFTSTILSNATFKDYKYFAYPPPSQWDSDPYYWANNTVSAFRMLSHSDQFKPDKTMMASQGIKVVGSDLGTNCGPAARIPGSCDGNSLFRVDRQATGASWQFNWLDADGSVVRVADASKPAGSYLIGSYVPWWNFHPGCWNEPRLSGVWVCPLDGYGGAKGTVTGARLDFSVRSRSDPRNAFTTESHNPQVIGWTSLYSDASRRMPLTKTEGTTGVTGNTGWYTVFQPYPSSSAAVYHAPRNLSVIVGMVPVGKWVYWTSCWPVGATLTVSRTFAWSSCQNTSPLRRVDSRATLSTTTDGGAYFVDAATGCLTIKVTEPGRPWQMDNAFEREGLRVEEQIGWFDQQYHVVAGGTAMASCDDFFCALQGDPVARKPAPIPDPAPAEACRDVAPPGTTCPLVKCGWAGGTYWGCSAGAVTLGGYCKATCGGCQVRVFCFFYGGGGGDWGGGDWVVVVVVVVVVTVMRAAQ